MLESTRISEKDAFHHPSSGAVSSPVPDLLPTSAPLEPQEESDPEEDAGFESDHLSVLEYSSREMSGWYGDRESEKVTQAYKGKYLNLPESLYSNLLCYSNSSLHVIELYSNENCVCF